MLQRLSLSTYASKSTFWIGRTWGFSSSFFFVELVTVYLALCFSVIIYLSVWYDNRVCVFPDYHQKKRVLMFSFSLRAEWRWSGFLYLSLSLSFGDGGGGVGLVAVATVVSRLWSSSSSKNFTDFFLLLCLSPFLSLSEHVCLEWRTSPSLSQQERHKYPLSPPLLNRGWSNTCVRTEGRVPTET